MTRRRSRTSNAGRRVVGNIEWRVSKVGFAGMMDGRSLFGGEAVERLARRESIIIDWDGRDPRGGIGIDQGVMVMNEM